MRVSIVIQRASTEVKTLYIGSLSVNVAVKFHNTMELGSLSNDDDAAEDDTDLVKKEFIFYKRNSRKFRSVQYANGNPAQLKYVTTA